MLTFGISNEGLSNEILRTAVFKLNKSLELSNVVLPLSNVVLAYQCILLTLKASVLLGFRDHLLQTKQFFSLFRIKRN